MPQFTSLNLTRPGLKQNIIISLEKITVIICTLWCRSRSSSELFLLPHFHQLDLNCRAAAITTIDQAMCRQARRPSPSYSVDDVLYTYIAVTLSKSIEIRPLATMGWVYYRTPCIIAIRWSNNQISTYCCLWQCIKYSNTKIFLYCYPWEYTY